MGRYRFNREQLKFVEDKRSFGGWVRVILKYFVLSLVLAVVYYVLFSLFVVTEQERALARETEIMEEEYIKLQEKVELLDNAMKNLQYRDREIYKSIFNADPPEYSAAQGYDLFEGMDTTRIESIIEDSKMRISVLEKGAKKIDASISDINGILQAMGDSVRAIPSIVPVGNFNISQSGASVGKKINPFYKSVAMHTGMDLLAGTGTAVVASADGVVESVDKKGKKEGNSIVVRHGNGYVTKYMNLGKVLVRKGQKVKQGSHIANVGMSGMSFAPHLHYEVWYKGRMMDPMNFFFASLTPQMYRDMAVIVANTGQSLD